MSLASILAGALGIKKKHPAVEQFEKDVAFFNELRQKIQLEQNLPRKQALLGEAAAALKDAKYNTIAKMTLAGLVDEKTDWDVFVQKRSMELTQALDGNEMAIEYGKTVMQRAQHELPILTKNIIGLASKGIVIAKGRELWAAYQREAGNVQEALGLWQRANAEKNQDKRQQIHAGIWSRAMNEQLSPIIRLEMLEPRNALVAQWKVLAQRLAKGEDVSQDLDGLKTPIDRALTKKLADFAKETFDVAVSVA